MYKSTHVRIHILMVLYSTIGDDGIRQYTSGAAISVRLL